MGFLLFGCVNILQNLSTGFLDVLYAKNMSYFKILYGTIKVHSYPKYASYVSIGLASSCYILCYTLSIMVAYFIPFETQNAILYFFISYFVMSDTEKMRTAVSRLFVESGEKERLLELLKLRLQESGWNDNLDAYSRDTVRNKNLQNASLDELTKEMGDYGRSTVNEVIKKDLLEHIKKFLDENLD
ncbi:transcription factor e(y)2-domain-containing protein [Gilbertella persicaria]|uniref:transcription factor e(y)2-domain-containing protein n=1 Tax=Gilbertella persicaria TaxID=101096 RepID=UPI00222083D0|nr:transcription factor e(y)2-domain-containing protein [Gilbertella persicaria]KAI8095046.1 transcription factor e(y)2-domain-containing protein [Gilbertella persicaria]